MKDNSRSSNVAIVGGSSKSYPKLPLLPHRQLTIGIIGVALVAVVISGIILRHYSSATHHKFIPPPSVSVVGSTKLIQDAEVALENAKTPSQKTAAYLQLGQAYLSDNQPTAAIQAFQNGNASDSTDQIASLSGQGWGYYLSNQISQSINDFQRALSLIQQSSVPEVRAEAAKYQNMIHRLQSGEPI